MINSIDIQTSRGEAASAPKQTGWRLPDSGRPMPTESIAAEVIHHIEDSIEYMRGHLNRPLQVSTLATVASLSCSHYFAMFKRVTGQSPIEFFIGLRMRRACDLLDDTSLIVKEVATKLGYDDQFYFSRVFKLLTQMPPTHYRTLDMVTRCTVKESLVPAYTGEMGTGGKRADSMITSRF